MNHVDEVRSLWGGPNPGRPVAAHELPNNLPLPFWMNSPPKMAIDPPRNLVYTGPSPEEMIADALAIEDAIHERAKRRERMKGQAEGLIVGLLLAGFFGLLLFWSF